MEIKKQEEYLRAVALEVTTQALYNLELSSEPDKILASVNEINERTHNCAVALDSIRHERIEKEAMFKEYLEFAKTIPGLCVVPFGTFIKSENMIHKIPYIVAVDFDDTLFCTKELIPDKMMIKLCRDLYEKGIYIIINTCRTGEQETEAIGLLKSNGVPFHKFNEHHPLIAKDWSPVSRKIYSNMDIDTNSGFYNPEEKSRLVEKIREKIDKVLTSFYPSERL